MWRQKPAVEFDKDELLLNRALMMAQDWGDDWLEPIQERLGKEYPHLTQENLNRLNAVAQEAMKYGHELVYSMAEKQDRADISQSNWKTAFSARYPWVNAENLAKLFSTGMYYARK